MKNHLTFLSCILFTLLLARPSVTQAQINIKSIGIGGSYWKPSLDYWNNRSMLTAYNNGTGAKFSGAVMPTAALEIGLTKGLSVGVRAGYYKQSVASTLSAGGINRDESLKLSIIPVSLDVKYTFAGNSTTGNDGKVKAPFLTPYIGVGLSRYFINTNFNRTVLSGGSTGSLSQSSAGNNYGVQLIVGADRKLVKQLYLGIDVRYHISSYNQVVQSTDAASSTTEKVSLSGLEAGLSLKLKFRE